MSNFQCEKCGMTNIDCGKDGFKTPKEIELEARVKELEEENNHLVNVNKKAKANLDAQFAEMEEKLIAEEMKNFELKERIEELETKIGWYKSYGKEYVNDE